MAFTFESFKPSTVDAFVDGLIEALKASVGDWFNTVQVDLRGQLEIVAQEALQTKQALAESRITEEREKRLHRLHRLAFQNTLIEMRLAAFRLLQQVVDTVFKAVGWAIYNHTGINLAPALVMPKP
ncbi:hypothetical protein [Amorphus orientalis]|uniref:Uncharacterized protein n=1 Tax=Amorphus orientalis TaxID=649198 RepID=A0AAE3VNV2_9HYPH|nr:hypothetical protein [Amorphus orientalis]MDQ0316074.1 hypothetical protein [Amorphus orientalis]